MSQKLFYCPEHKIVHACLADGYGVRFCNECLANNNCQPKQNKLKTWNVKCLVCTELAAKLVKKQ